jgi:predicted TIM-barrel fold metal-dependent hydrolase
MVVDVHAHFNDATPPSRITRYAGVCGIDLVLVSNRDAASHPEGVADYDEAAANGVCLQACAENTRLVPLYWVRPGRVDSSVNALAGALAGEPFVGVLFSPTENGYDAADPMLDPYFDVIEKAGRPALVCVSGDERSSPHRVFDLARRHARVPVVMCACGAPTEVRAEALDLAHRAAQQQTANLYLDTSHATAESVRNAVEIVGPERILFGTNALSYEDAHVPRHIALLDELRRTLAPRALHQVLSQNAVELFRLTGLPAR